MATKVVDTAGHSWVEGRHTVTLSNGNAISVVVEGMNLKVLETSDAERDSGWTLRGTWTVDTPGAAESIAAYSIAAWADNSISIIVQATDSTNGTYQLYHRKLTYSGYAWGSVENVQTLTPTGSMSQLPYGNLDIDVSDAGAVVYTVSRHTSSGGTTAGIFRLQCRSTAGAWGAAVETTFSTLSGTSVASPIISAGLTTLTGGSGTARPCAIAAMMVARNSSTGQGVQSGIKTYSFTINEGTGAVQSITARDTFTTAPYGKAVPQGNFNYSALKLFRGQSGDEIHLGWVQGLTSNENLGSDNEIGYARIYWNGVNPWATLHPFTTRTAYNAAGNTPASGINAGYGTSPVGISFGHGGMNFLLNCATSATLSESRILSAQVTWDVNTGTPTLYWNRGGYWDGGVNGTRGVLSGGNRNNNLNKHDVQIVFSDQKPYHKSADTPGALTSVTPVDGSTVTTSMPVLSATFQDTTYWSQAHGRVHWQLATDAGFTTGVKNDYSPWTAVEGSSTTPLTLSKTIDPSLALSGGFWYMRARMEFSTGQVGAWSSTNDFTIGHPPLGIPLSPLNNQRYEYAAGLTTFAWTFTDPAPDDVQTAFQVRVRQANETGTIIHDSGKVTSSAKTYQWTVPSGNKNQTLYWEVKLWDSQDSQGNYSAGNSFFELVDPAYATITSPTAAQVLNQGNPTVTATVTSTGGRVVKEHVFRIIQAGETIWTSPRSYGSWGNGATIQAAVPGDVLATGGLYTIQVVTVDDVNISMISAPVQFSTSWSVPLSIAVHAASAASFNTLGYIALTWTDANRESGFNGWAIYRKSEIIDPFTQAVVQDGTYELIDIVSTSLTVGEVYTYLDYFAPAGLKVSYLIKQRVVRNSGFEVESGNTTPAVCYPDTDGYWLIDKFGDAPNALKLPQVTSDNFTEEQEESIYIVQGRGRHVDKGEFLGANGSLTAQIRYNGSISPRLVRQRLLDIQKESEPLWLRNPFGDVWKVNVSSMQVSRVAGVGRSEFCDVTLPYSEVS